jgi:hypothetical protein
MRIVARSNLVVLCLLAIAGSAGCNLFPSVLPGGSSDKAGEDLASAKRLDLDANDSASISGSLSTAKANVFDLGPCAAGDRLIVTVDPTLGSALDPTTAIFDAAGELVAFNDDADLMSGQIGSYLDEIVWDASDHFYLAISKFYRDTQGGTYEASIQIERGGSVTPPPVQILLLNFAGGSVTIPGEGTIACAAFDAADISAAYTGQTAQIKAKIIETVQQNYRNTGLQVVTSDDAPPAPGTFSTVYFGAYSTDKFGIAEGVDQGNKNRCDDGVVFTDQFDVPFHAQPTVDGIGIAIGNVAAHEAGHLLGLNHVSDVTDLMDTTGSASTLLADQEFKTSALHESVFPFGSQNGPAMLNRVVPR